MLELLAQTTQPNMLSAHPWLIPIIVNTLTAVLIDLHGWTNSTDGKPFNFKLFAGRAIAGFLSGVLVSLGATIPA